MADLNLCETARVDQPKRLQVGGKRKRSAASITQNLKPILINQEFTKMSTNIEQFSYVSKLVALTHLYVELSLPLPAALRAAEADLR